MLAIEPWWRMSVYCNFGEIRDTIFLGCASINLVYYWNQSHDQQNFAVEDLPTCATKKKDC